MLALCWLIFRSWVSFSCSWTSLARLQSVFYSCSSFFSRFGSLRVGFSGVRGQFGGSEIVFFGVLSCARVCNEKKLPMCTNHSFSCVFVWFLHIASFVFKPQNNAKSFPEPVQRTFLQWILLPSRLGVDSGRVWRSLGRLWASFCPVLVGSWPIWGASWPSLGHFWGALGCLLAALGSFRATF